MLKSRRTSLAAFALLFCLCSIVSPPLVGISFATEDVAAKCDLSKLRQKANSVLSDNDNVAIRKEIGAVFKFIDCLKEWGDEESLLTYLPQALKHYPWALEYQTLYAEQLAKTHVSPLVVAQRAALVMSLAESDALINRARAVLNKPPLPKLKPISRIEGDDYALVLIPIGDIENSLVWDIRVKLENILGIPVYAQDAGLELPPPGRDRRDNQIRYWRERIIEEKDDAKMAAALTKQNTDINHLDNEITVIDVFRDYLRTKYGAGAVEELEAALKESKGQAPQWNSDDLYIKLREAMKPYIRDKIGYIGITSKDIYRNDNNFIFGFASGDDRIGVISYKRFSSEFNDEAPDRRKVVSRTVKQALSSTGFIYGIERCSNPKCARAYPHDLPEHDAKSEHLCPECLATFERIFSDSSEWKLSLMRMKKSWKRIMSSFF